jgi:gamma-glutamyltranspeptidase/glutathione hydrolase
MENPFPTDLRLALAGLLGIVLSISCTATDSGTGPNVTSPPDSYGNGLVVSVDPIASGVGRQILEQGGNAVDAAVATGFALAVTHPSAGNLGGGGFMMVRMAESGEVQAVDYREKAPRASTPTMFLDPEGEVDREKSGVGYLVIGVPGTVRGFWEAMERFGDLDWETVIEPAVALARDGFVVDEVLSGSLKHRKRSWVSFRNSGSRIGSRMVRSTSLASEWRCPIWPGPSSKFVTWVLMDSTRERSRSV